MSDGVEEVAASADQRGRPTASSRAIGSAAVAVSALGDRLARAAGQQAGTVAPTSPQSPYADLSTTSRPWLPWLALAACAVGVLALFLPVIEVAGFASFSLVDVPWLGSGLVASFLVLTLLPVVDVMRSRVSSTAWLLVPGLLGFFPTAALFFAIASVPDVVQRAWMTMPDGAVETGGAGAALLGADVALVAVGVAAVASRVRARRARRASRARTPTER